MSAAPSTPESDPPPATIAVALEEQAGQSAPVVTASGRGYVAEQILAIAFANNVKVRTDADLVQILSAIDVDSEIPTEAYAAVSEILAYVYKANGAPPPAPLQMKTEAPASDTPAPEAAP